MFQGRFKAILVQKDVYLLELARYIALNPVRAQMVEVPKRGAGAVTAQRLDMKKMSLFNA
ncbi:hypothetical protein [Nitrosomonas sp. Nm34]|uniref:hypothetical protein n=1 Tax=Nitrosomonas sp. Nm34 TaxID=1881055 RepID=UPI000A520C16|nr:hypothetical protein [Nitrosomonas sp. Nm34]